MLPESSCSRYRNFTSQTNLLVSDKKLPFVVDSKAATRDNMSVNQVPSEDQRRVSTSGQLVFLLKYLASYCFVPLFKDILRV